VHVAGRLRDTAQARARHSRRGSYQIKSNLFAINKVHNKQFIQITYHFEGQTGDSFALMSAHKN